MLRVALGRVQEHALPVPHHDERQVGARWQVERAAAPAVGRTVTSPWGGRAVMTIGGTRTRPPIQPSHSPPWEEEGDSTCRQTQISRLVEEPGGGRGTGNRRVNI